MDVLSNTDSMSSHMQGEDLSTVPPPAMSIDKLLPALLECFGIILCGYIAGRANIITSTQAKGLGNFVSKFALPALLFKNMVLLDFGNVIWPFLWSILVAKVTVFVLVCVLTLLVANKDSRYSKAGLFSIFATQSNDFALGYPIVEALYRNTHPEYVQYIYLVAPVSLMVLNPIGFAFCEIQKWRREQRQQHNKLHVVKVVIFQVLKNPIVFMVVIGIAAHFVLGPKIPGFMQEFLDGLANSFGGAALFYLGLTMVGQLKKLTRSTVVALILLITAKLLVMPLFCRGMVEILDRGNMSSQNRSSLSNYAFLYGVFPTAPSVAIYASHYNMELQMTSGMVISTFLSAPIMYVSAWLLTIPWMDPKPLASALQNISFNISIVSLFALVWCVAVCVMSKKFRRRPHVFTINLFVAQLGACVGMIAWNFVVVKDNLTGQVLTFTLLYGSLYSTYIWPGLIALSLFLLKRNEQLKVQPGILMLIGWGVPGIAVSILLMVGQKIPDTIDSAFFFGPSQVICTVVVLGAGIALTGICLTLLRRDTHDYQTLEHGSLNGTAEDLRTDSSIQTPCVIGSTAIEDGNRRGCQECACNCSLIQAVPNDICNSRVKDTPSIQPGQCGNCCDSSHCLLVEEEQKQQTADRQVARHVLLCLLLTVSLLANISSYLWWLFSPVPGQLYLELQFFCAVINFGQGFISFAIFGLDKHLIIIPFKKRLAQLMQSQSQEAAGASDVSEEIKLTCSQFLKYHKEQCAQDIVQKRRCGEHSIAHTFLGSEMVLWLQTVGLASDQGEALLYGSRLLEGGVIHHITHDYDFQDDSLHYTFTEGCVGLH